MCLNSSPIPYVNLSLIEDCAKLDSMEGGGEFSAFSTIPIKLLNGFPLDSIFCKKSWSGKLFAFLTEIRCMPNYLRDQHSLHKLMI
ncbi:MAG: hypothetical protein IIC75_05965 [Bacteroidetes bacterium]|nr:hypothetical protein [Bacteroidota bacterium]